jgi:general secretion pathway protein G
MGQNTPTGDEGFTLIEVIIVLTLIGILVGLGLPQFQSAGRRAREAVLKEDLFQFRKVIDQYRTDKGKYPTSLQTLADEHYLRTIPIDPMTKSATTWVEVRETPPPEELVQATELGIIDVHSGSEEKGLDGTPYNAW